MRLLRLISLFLFIATPVFAQSVVASKGYYYDGSWQPWDSNIKFASIPTVTIGPKKSSATNTSVSVGNTSTSVLSANSTRQELILVNDSDESIYISLNSTAVINQGIRLNANGGAYIDDSYTGAVSAICSSGSKNLTVVEK